MSEESGRMRIHTKGVITQLRVHERESEHYAALPSSPECRGSGNDAGGARALRSTEGTTRKHEHDPTYQIGQLRSRARRTKCRIAKARDRAKPLPDRYEAEARDYKLTGTLHTTYRSYVQNPRARNAKTKSPELVEGDRACGDTATMLDFYRFYAADYRV